MTKEDYTFIDKESGICDITGKNIHQCDGDCPVCPEYKDYLYTVLVEDLKRLGEYDMTRAYVTAMAQKYPNRIVNLKISNAPKPRKEKRGRSS